MVKTADEALAGRKGKDDACQSETVCHWSRNEALPQLRGAPAARSFRQARYGVSYAKQDPKSFTVHAILPAASGWAQSFSCDLLEHAMPLPGPSSQGPSALFCDITDGPSNGSVFGFQAVGKGPASVTLKSAARSR